MAPSTTRTAFILDYMKAGANHFPAHTGVFLYSGTWLSSKELNDGYDITDSITSKR